MKRSIFREVVLLCVAITLAALVVSFFSFAWTIAFGLTREVGNAAKGIATREASRFDLARHESLLEALASPEQPAVPFGKYMSDLHRTDPAAAARVEALMSGLDDKHDPAELVLVLDS